MNRILASFAIALLLGATTAPGAPSEEEQAAQVAGLIRDLGHEDYETRDEAHRQLQKLGVAAFDALSAAEEDENPEIARRAQMLLRSIRIPWTREDDPPEVKRRLRNYDELNFAQRSERIRRLAPMTADDATAVLCRIVRYEKSPPLAKFAAMLVIDRPPPEGDVLRRQIETIRSALAGCKRPAATWLLAYAEFFSKPEEALAAWKTMIDAEMELLQSGSRETSAEIVIALSKRRYAMFLASGKKEEGLAALREIASLHEPSAASLAKLIQWLSDQQAWTVIDEVAKQHEGSFNSEPRLLYALAEARQKAGRADAAKEAAARALATNPGNLEKHFEIAYWLSEAGFFDWAEAEYRHVIAAGPVDSGMVVQSNLFLSVMLQDREKYLEAAKAREAVVQRIEKSPELRELLEIAESAYYSPARIRAAMDYCFAMHYGQTGDLEKQRRHLERAIASDPDDADVLIALWKLPKQTEAQQASIAARLKRAVAGFERKIANLEAKLGRGEEEGKLAQAYNEYAWLVANTTGDFDKALRYATTACELRPETAGVLDTLAHCKFAKGDLAGAVETQRIANRLEPHSGSIARALRRFEKALAESSSSEAVPRAAEP